MLKSARPSWLSQGRWWYWQVVTQALQQPRGPPDRLRTEKFPPGKVCLKAASHPLTSSLPGSRWSPELTRPTALTWPLIPSTPPPWGRPPALGPAPRHTPTAAPSVSCSPTCPSHRCRGDHSKSSRGSLLPGGYNPNSGASPGQAQMALSQPTESRLTSRLTAHPSSSCADPLHAQVSGRTCSFQSSWKAPVQSTVQLKHHVLCEPVSQAPLGGNDHLLYHVSVVSHAHPHSLFYTPISFYSTLCRQALWLTRPGTSSVLPSTWHTVGVHQMFTE